MLKTYKYVQQKENTDKSEKKNFSKLDIMKIHVWVNFDISTFEIEN